MVKTLALAGMAVLTMGALAGCSSNTTESTAAPTTAQSEAEATTAGTSSAETTTAAPAASADLKGSISMVGSTSMEKFATALSEIFMEKYPNVTVQAEFVGSGAGVEAVNNGSADIGNSSRNLKDEEKANGIAENIVAIDGIAVVIDPANAVEDLTKDQLTSIYNGTITNWKDAGGADQPIVVIGRESGSGTRSAFEEIGIIGDVLDIASLEKVAEEIVTQWGQIDILLNIAGGNMPGATLEPDQNFYDMDISCWEKVTSLNMNGTVYPSMIFGKVMAEQKKGCIINVSSMAAYSAITRVPGYSAAKTAVANFTQWLASEMALKYGDGIRVNAIAPGFFIGDQNRRVLINPDGSLTNRSKKVLAKTPMNRFGDIKELNGAVQFLCSEAASFVTGAMLPIDGGFSAFSGV